MMDYYNMATHGKYKRGGGLGKEAIHVANMIQDYNLERELESILSEIHRQQTVGATSKRALTEQLKQAKEQERLMKARKVRKAHPKAHGDAEQTSETDMIER